MQRFNFALVCFALLGPFTASAQSNSNTISTAVVADAEKLDALDFSSSQIEQMLGGLREQLRNYQRLRGVSLSNSVPPCLIFNPIPVGMEFETIQKRIHFSPIKQVKLPKNKEALAFYSVRELGELIKRREITSEQLTRFYLDRLKKYGPGLECVVTLTEDLALRRAKAADAEIVRGIYRGPLHGIPYGAKDLLAVKGIPTTWGAAPYTNQVFQEDATVISKLDEAGAVLVAKLTLGELAMGETWFGGMTRNPWNLKEGSSGSSAGSCAAVSAGLVPFAIGSETLGSIVSPCDRCGDTGLRPTFGRVSRTGAMTLSWSMDKLGPICREVEDCAIVFDAIRGADGIDPTVRELPFNYTPRVRLENLRIGFLQADFDRETGVRKTNDLAALEVMRSLGARLIPIELPKLPVGDLTLVLSTEAAAAFDDLTLSGQDAWLKRQDEGSWPNTFRRRQFVPAVEYLQAQRIRTLLIQETAKLFQQVDLYLAPSLAGRNLPLTNLTGHPCVVVPDGFTTNNTPTSICFIGKLYGEGQLLAVARAYQQATDFHRRHPHLTSL